MEIARPLLQKISGRNYPEFRKLGDGIYRKFFQAADEDSGRWSMHGFQQPAPVDRTFGPLRPYVPRARRTLSNSWVILHFLEIFII